MTIYVQNTVENNNSIVIFGYFRTAFWLFFHFRGYFLAKTYSIPHYSWNGLGRVGKTFPIPPHFNIIQIIIYARRK